MGSHEIWKYPYYEYIIDNNERNNATYPYKRIVVNVTDSAIYVKPNISIPQKKVFEKVLSKIKKKSNILDFGAGKLRISKYLADEGYSVKYVEFEKLEERGGKFKSTRSKATRHYAKCTKLSYPHEFHSRTTDNSFDLVVAINVHNVMPVPAERLLSIMYCRRKLKKDGYMLYYGQHDEKGAMENYDDDPLGDGCYNNKNKNFKTFYYNFTKPEIDSMFLANGFRLEEEYGEAGGRNYARLYKIVFTNPLEKILTSEHILKNANLRIPFKKTDVKVGVEYLKNTKKNINELDFDQMKIETYLINALQTMPVSKNAHGYHNLIASIFMKLFDRELSKFKIEQLIGNGNEKVDILAENVADKGFFKNLSIKKIDAGYVVIECKNYAGNLENPEFFQIASRLEHTFTKFGIITYRKDSERSKIVSKCRNYVHSGKCIICLSDKDIIQLLKLRRDNNDEDIDEYLDTKLKEVWT